MICVFIRYAPSHNPFHSYPLLLYLWLVTWMSKFDLRESQLEQKQSSSSAKGSGEDRGEGERCLNTIHTFSALSKTTSFQKLAIDICGRRHARPFKTLTLAVRWHALFMHQKTSGDAASPLLLRAATNIGASLSLFPSLSPRRSCRGAEVCFSHPHARQGDIIYS